MKIRTLGDVMTPLNPKSLEEWKRYQQDLMASVRFSSSVDLLHHDAPLNARVFDAVEYDGFVVEKVIFQSLPGFYVTGNLYRPKDTSKKYPAILNPHGHWQHGRIETVDLARIPQRCANLALRGMVAFIYDMIGYNDSRQIPHENFDPAWEDWLYGRFSLQLNNSVKAVDFVSSLPYVDETRIGCTGCSGGGTQTYFLSVIDPRIKAAAPINMASVRMQGGCQCENTAFLRTKYSNIDYVMAIAPRPLFLSGADGDWTVSSETVEFPAVEHVYELYGKQENFEHFYQHAPHCYNLPIRERVYDFFCRHFGLENLLKNEVDLEIDTEKLLIGDIRPYVPAEGFIENDEQLFALVKAIIKKNLARLSEDEHAKIEKRVFCLDDPGDLDIPYAYGNWWTPNEMLIGRCPEPMDDTIVQYPHTYYIAEDARRVGALVKLFREYPAYTFKAGGKSAALCEIAARFVPETKTELTDIDRSAIRIPGIALTETYQ